MVMSQLDCPSLSTRMVLSFIALVLLTVSAVGIPAIWLIQDRMSQQAWSQVEQAMRASKALYAARETEIADLAVLTAQRPTLRDLVTQGESEVLSSYLTTLRAGAGLDLLIVCGSDEKTIAQTGKEIPADVCWDDIEGGFYIMPAGSSPRVWLLAGHPLGGETGYLGEVVLGKAVDNTFATRIGEQAGLEHILLVSGLPAATTLSGDIGAVADIDRRSARSSSGDGGVRGTFSFGGRPYYFARFSLPGTNIQDEVALDVADLTATRRRLMAIVVVSIASVATGGSLTGVMLAHRIARPLGRLTETATRMSAGDIDSPVAVETCIREIALVTRALEGARVDLQRMVSRLQEEKAWTDHLLEAMAEGIITLNAQDQITFFSRGAERITGWRRDQVLDRCCDEIFKSVEAEEPFSQLIPGPGRKRKLMVKLADGRQATLAVTGARLTPPEEGDAEVALVFRDVSEEEAVHRLLGHFLANVAHEFRTPLSALAASTELLLDRTSELSVAELKTLLSSLHLGVLGLQTLVDNLLESASIEAGRFRVYPHPSDLGGIIAEAVRTMQPLLDKRGQRLCVDLPAAVPTVEADPRRSVQVLVNLLSNASKYGPDHTEILIGATASDGWVRLSVADRGPGIPPSYRNSLFRRFEVPSRGTNDVQYGTGLGLSVVKAIVEAHGGEVGVDDRPGGGSIFWFTLPRVEEE